MMSLASFRRAFVVTVPCENLTALRCARSRAHAAPDSRLKIKDWQDDSQ